MDSTATVRLYNTPNSARHEEIPVKSGFTLRELIGNDNCVVYVNDTVIPRAFWARVRPLPGAKVTIQTVAAGGDSSKAILRIVATVAIAAAAIYTGGLAAGALGGFTTFAGAAAGAGASLGVTLVGTLALNALIPPSSQNTPGYQSPKAQSSISGAQNRIDPFGKIDKIYGRMKTIPKLGAKTYTEIKGDNQYLRMLAVVGHGPLKIEDIKIGDTALDNFDNFEVEVREGRPDDDPITLYPNAVDETSLSVTLNDAGTTGTRTTAENTTEISIDLGAGGGLARAEADGTGNNRIRVDYLVEYQAVGDTTWKQPSSIEKSPNIVDPVDLANTLQVNGKTLNTMRFSFSWKVPRGQYNVRLTRKKTYESTDSNSEVAYDADRVSAAMQWTAIRSIQDSSVPVIDYDGPLALIALKIKATDQLNGVISDLSCIATSYLQVWDGTQWTEQLSSNPAWCYLDRFIGNGVKTTVDLSRIDTDAIVDWASRCDNLGYTFNAKVRSGTRFDSMRDIASIGRGSFGMNGDLFSIVEDVPQTQSRQMYTPRNSWNFSGTKAFTEQPHALRVQWINPDAGWEQDERIVYADGYDKTNAEKFETLDLTYGCTDPDLAFKQGRYHLAVGKLRPETFAFYADLEHIVAKCGDLIRIQYDAALIGLGSGRVISLETGGAGNTTGIVVDQTLTMIDGTDYAIRARLDTGEQIYARIVTVNGETNTLEFDTSIAGFDQSLINEIQADDLIAMGEVDKETIPVLIKSISDVQGDADGYGEATVTCVPYNDAIYTADSETIPAYDPTITRPTDLSKIPPPAPVIYQVRSDSGVYRTASSGTTIPRIVVYYTIPSSNAPTATGVQADIRHEGGQWIRYTFDVNGQCAFDDVIVGDNYDLRIRTVNANGTPSAWTYTSETVQGQQALPPDSVSVIAKTFSITLIPHSAVAGELFEFFRAQSDLALADVETNATNLGIATKLEDTGLDYATTYYYWVRGVVPNSTSNRSAFYALSATTRDDASALLKAVNNRLDKTALTDALRSDIELITAPESVANSVNARLSDEQAQRIQAIQDTYSDFQQGDTATLSSAKTYADTDSQAAQRVDALVANFGGSAASALSYTISQADDQLAITQTFNEIDARFDSIDTSSYATVSDLSSAQADDVSARSQLQTTIAADYNTKLDDKADVNASGLIIENGEVAIDAAHGPFAQATKQVSIDDGDSIATLEEQFTAQRSDIGGLQATWTVRIKGTTTEGDPVAGGLGLGASGGSTRFIVDADEVAFGKVGQSGLDYPFYFDSGTGRAIVKNANIGDLTFTKLKASDGSLIVQNEKLLADYIDVDNLQVNYSAVIGPKPPDDADKTSANTAADTSAVSGRSSSSLVSDVDYSKRELIKGPVNLIETPTFNSGAGNWSGGTIDPNQYLVVRTRDTFEYNNFDVRPGERLFFQASVSTYNTTHLFAFGLNDLSSGYYPAVDIGPDQKKLIKGSLVVPVGVNVARPWLQIDATNNFGNVAVKNLYIGRYQPGADVTDDNPIVQRADSWTRPNTTRIDGNQIYTGDAYVDTLQIKGEAVTVPLGVENSNSQSFQADGVWHNVLRDLVSGFNGINTFFQVSIEYDFYVVPNQPNVSASVHARIGAGDGWIERRLDSGRNYYIRYTDTEGTTSDFNTSIKLSGSVSFGHLYPKNYGYGSLAIEVRAFLNNYTTSDLLLDINNVTVTAQGVKR